MTVPVSMFVPMSKLVPMLVPMPACACAYDYDYACACVCTCACVEIRNHPQPLLLCPRRPTFPRTSMRTTVWPAQGGGVGNVGCTCELGPGPGSIRIAWRVVQRGEADSPFFTSTSPYVSIRLYVTPDTAISWSPWGGGGVEGKRVEKWW